MDENEMFAPSKLGILAPFPIRDLTQNILRLAPANPCFSNLKPKDAFISSEI